MINRNSVAMAAGIYFLCTIYTLFCFGTVAAIVYAAIHFISKFW